MESDYKSIQWSEVRQQTVDILMLLPVTRKDDKDKDDASYMLESRDRAQKY